MKVFSHQLSAISRKCMVMIALSAVSCLLIAVAAEAIQMDDVLKAFVKENYPWAEVDIADMVVSTEAPDEKPERILVEKGLPNKTVFILEYKDGKRVSVSAYVKAYDWAVMTRRAFKKGHQLQKEDFYTTLMEISRIPKDAMRAGDSVEGAALSRSVAANTPLIAGMVQETVQVKRGHRVMIVAESGTFSITARGELKENGYVGSDVRVVNLDSKKVIVGRLISENMVKVVF